MSADPFLPESDSAPRPKPVPEPDALGSEPPLPTASAVRGTRAIAVVAIVAVALAGAFIAAERPRQRAQAALEAHAHATESSVPRVDLVQPRIGASRRALALPGSVRALEETVLYARANGYLKRWLVDIGDRVHEGQLLAEIDAPDLRQDLEQARAQLTQAEAAVQQAVANQAFAQADLERYRQLAPSGYASRRELEQRQASAAVAVANVGVARAAVGAQRANVDRLTQLVSFARVLAPFDGTITARTVDRGALVTTGTTPLFRIAATDPVRVFIDVPQDVAPSIRPGVAAAVTVREYPGRVFQGQVARAAGALDATSRTMSTEVRVPNTDGALLVGMYAEVALTLPEPHRVLEIPATAVTSDSHGVRVQIVGGDHRVHFVPVVIERDTGPSVLVSSGLSETDHVLRISNAALAEGTMVDPGT